MKTLILYIFLLIAHLSTASDAESAKGASTNLSDECQNKQLAPFFIGASYESVKNADFSVFQVLKENNNKKAGGYMRQITAGKDYIADGYLIFKGKKNTDTIIMTELMINAIKPEAIVQYITSLGKPQKVLMNQTPPNILFPEMMKQWTEKLWVIDNCSLGVAIYEYSGNKPDKGFFVYRTMDLNYDPGK